MPTSRCASRSAKCWCTPVKPCLRQELVDIVEDELNVKAFEFVEQEGALVNYKVLPDNKLLGPKFGAKFPEVTGCLGYRLTLPGWLPM